VRARPRVSRTRLAISFVLGVAIVGAVVWFIDTNELTYEKAWQALLTISVVWQGLLIAAGVLNIVVYPFTVLVAIPALTYWRGFIERQSGFLISNAIPGGGAVAVGTQYAILNRYQVPPALSAAAVSADAVWTYLLTLGLPAIGAGLLVIEGRHNAQLTVLAIVGLVAVVVSLVVIATLLRSESGARRVGTWGQAVANRVYRIVKRPPPDIVGGAVTFHETAHDLVARKWLALTITNVAAQATPFVVLLAALAGLGVLPAEISLIEAFAAYSAAILLTSFPITPGGLVTVDAALIGLLVAFGASPAEAAAADVVWRLVWFLPQLLVGTVTFLGYLIARRRRSSVIPRASTSTSD